jgi:hypothetical protein
MAQEWHPLSKAFKSGILFVMPPLISYHESYEAVSDSYISLLCFFNNMFVKQRKQGLCCCGVIIQ